MDSDEEDILIVGVEDSVDVVCLSGGQGKGKNAAHPGNSRREAKKSSRNVGKDTDDCLVILDGSSGEDGDYVEMTGGGNSRVKDDLESIVGPSSPKKLRPHEDTELTIVDVVAGKKLKEKKRFHEDSLPKNERTAVATPSTSSSTLPSATSEGSKDTKQSTPTPPLPVNNSTVSPPSQTLGAAQHERVPTCWTNCPNCPPDMQTAYHLIDVAYNSAEWSVVSSPLTQGGFVVNRVQRIQNETLWQRLCYEKKLMLRDRNDVNEQLLYHTSRANITTICEEGLDHRLSTNGHFGHGIYFSDSPVKCNSYWSGIGAGGRPTGSRHMFCCRVLLGEIKNFPKGKYEQLRREPPKPNPKPGETKFYDSVRGNLTGLNEFVVYNGYRVMPEYVIHYTTQTPAPMGPPPAAAAAAAAMMGAGPNMFPNPFAPLAARGFPWAKIVTKPATTRKKKKRKRS